MYVYDGGSTSGVEIARLTGSSPPAAVTSARTEIFINFISDVWETADGFRMQFDAISG